MPAAVCGGRQNTAARAQAGSQRRPEAGRLAEEPAEEKQDDDAR